MSISDSASYVPPMTGTYHYNDFQPGATGHPAVGGNYTDPVFSETITRLTAETAAGSVENIYARNGYHNADSTKCFSWVSGGMRVINSSTGEVLKTAQPTGLASYEVQFSPSDPDIYYYIGTGANNTKLLQRNITTDTTSTVRDFTSESGGSALQALGGTNDWVDSGGRYFVVRWGGTSKVWDKTEDAVYTNTVSDYVSIGGWVGITPNASHVVTAAGATAWPNVEHHSYTLNHTTNTVAASPVQWCGLSGDHGDLISCTDGKSYAVKFNSDDDPPGLYLWDLDESMAGLTAAQQIAAATALVTVSSYNEADGHISCVATGTFQNWVFWSSEYTSGDAFDSTPTGNWSNYRQEIIAVNCITLEVRRLCHHRSRSVSNYFSSPRVCASWNGTRVMWASNFNDNDVADYADLYVILNPLGSVYPANTLVFL